ncbi:hypothetical protein TYRP_011696 [Tyrophagus putrescentiae]|nr:hypothetical protein TYRP_011696 [Tyrophagus putrescentiae]
MEQVMGSRDFAAFGSSSNPPDQLASSGMSSSYRASSGSGMSTADSTSTSTTNVFFNNNAHVQRHLLYGGRLRSPRHLSAYDLSLYGSLALSILLLVTSLVVQFRFRKYETRETFFIVRNLLLSLLLIQLTFLLGTTFHMDLFWVKVARWTPLLAEVTSSPSSSSSSNTFLTFARLQHSLCLSVPVFLHFIHLAVLFWMLSHTILLYQRFWRPQVSGTHTGAGEDDTHDRHLLHSCCKAGGGGSGINGCRRSMKTGSGGKSSKGKKCNVEVNNSNSSQLSLTSKECRRRYLKKLRANRHFCGSASSSSSSPSSSLSSSSSFFSSNQPFGVKDEGLEEESSAYHHHLCERHRLEEKMSVSLPNQNQGSDLLGNRCSSATVTLKVAEDAAGQLKNSKRCSYCCGCFSTSSSPPTTSALFFCTWKCIHFIAFSMGLPFLLVLFSYLLNSKGYETRRYCWMSIEGGIQYSFIIPVLGLISTMSTSPFELIFALSNCLHAFLVFYYHCYQRYNIHVFLGHRCRRLHLKRRLAKLLYRLLSALNLNNRAGAGGGDAGATSAELALPFQKQVVAKTTAAPPETVAAAVPLRVPSPDPLHSTGHQILVVVVMISFPMTTTTTHQHHHFHNQQQQQQQQQQYSSSFVSGNTSGSAVRGYPSKAYSDDQVFQQQQQQQQQQHYQSGQPVQPPVLPTTSTTEYKCNSSGLYCNHCYYCDSCGSQQVVTFDPRTTITKEVLRPYAATR